MNANDSTYRVIAPSTFSMIGGYAMVTHCNRTHLSDRVSEISTYKLFKTMPITIFGDTHKL